MEHAVRRLRFDIAYDGGAFHGWAAQPGLRTVQGVLEEALERVLRAPGPRLTVAGRTDAGVHAAGQVAHADFTVGQWEALAAGRAHRRGAGGGPDEDPAGIAAELGRRLNGAVRARDVVVTSCRLAPEGFDARFSAVWRRYVYRVADGPARWDPLQRHRTLWHPRPLDEAAMDRAARTLTGLHDFAAYCKPRAGSTTIRELQDFRWSRTADALEARVRADAFCHGMVRSLVGACLAVGEGRLSAHDPLALREAGRRTGTFAVAPAHGLTLTQVCYPPDDELAARAAQTRAVRTLAAPAGRGTGRAAD